MVECEFKSVTLNDLMGKGFNRYMVECESRNVYALDPSELVLIDTWWNVNCIRHFERLKHIYVLIDTWWNVNTSSGSQSPYPTRPRFNRYMVECE